MKSMSHLTLNIGDRLEVTPTSQVRGDLWAAEPPSLLKEWSCSLIHRASMNILSGQPLTGWVLNVDAAQLNVEVSDSNFGFLPISDRMRSRYVSSLNPLRLY